MISIKNITRDFGALQVLKGIDLDINRGEILSIVGPSGAGKTTLLQIIGTLDRATSGSVMYDGEDVMRYKDTQLAQFRNRHIGFVFQFHQLLPEFSVLENVAMPALIGGKKHSEAYARAKELVEYLGLGQRLDHRPSQLSGGERQRVAVARALVNNPEKMFEVGVTTRYLGSGVGLASVKNILNSIKANIYFLGNGVYLKGATFRIEFES